MIFAHGPAGFLASLLTKPFWRKKCGIFNPRTTYWFMAIGFFGGIFPDIDLFYYYLVNAAASHRALLTHTPVFYISVFIALFPLFLALKKPKWCIGLAAFILGALSHMATDTVGAQIRFFYPFSDTFYGITDLNVTFITSNALFLNFLMEGIFFFFFFYVLMRMTVKRLLWRVVLTTALIFLFIAGLGLLTYANQHVYHSPYDVGYGDMDQDGKVNGDDLDMDGDGVRNIHDEDSDNDGRTNIQSLAENSEQFAEMWYDPTDGGFIQIPIRLGLITNNDLVRRLYATIGIPLRPEMVEDYAQHPEGYTVPPTDEQFDRSKENIRTWLDHRGLLETDLSVGRYQIGDILFFQKGQVGVVTGFTNRAEVNVLDAYKDRPVSEVTLDTLVGHAGPVIARGKVLHPPTLTPTESTSAEAVSE